MTVVSDTPGIPPSVTGPRFPSNFWHVRRALPVERKVGTVYLAQHFIDHISGSLAQYRFGSELVFLLLKRWRIENSLVRKNAEQAGELFETGTTTSQYHGQAQFGLVFFYRLKPAGRERLNEPVFSQ